MSQPNRYNLLQFERKSRKTDYEFHTDLFTFAVQFNVP